MITKKFLVLFVLFLIPIVSAQNIQVDTIYSQAQIDSVNMQTINLDYQTQPLELRLESGTWVLQSQKSFLTVYPLGNGNYEVQRDAFIYKHKILENFGFILCMIVSGFDMMTCYQNHIKPIFDNQFQSHNYLQIRYLTSLQTGGSPMIPTVLQDYWMGD